MTDRVQMETNASPQIDEVMAQSTQPAAEERPEWLPEKFESAADLAKAYSELESRMGSHKTTRGSTRANRRCRSQ